MSERPPTGYVVMWRHQRGIGMEQYVTAEYALLHAHSIRLNGATWARAYEVRAGAMLVELREADAMEEAA